MFQLVARTAEADQLSLLCVWIKNRQRKIRTIRQVFHMMDDGGWGVAAFLFAPVTLPPVEEGHFSAGFFPFRPVVERSLPACLDQSFELFKSCF